VPKGKGATTIYSPTKHIRIAGELIKVPINDNKPAKFDKILGAFVFQPSNTAREICLLLAVPLLVTLVESVIMGRQDLTIALAEIVTAIVLGLVIIPQKMQLISTSRNGISTYQKTSVWKGIAVMFSALIAILWLEQFINGSTPFFLRFLIGAILGMIKFFNK